MSSVFEEAYGRHTGSLAEGGAKDIPRHKRWIEVPAGVSAPGVFTREGAEVGFWILLESHNLRQEQSILQAAMGKRGEMNIARGSAMVRDAMRSVCDEHVPTEHEPEDTDLLRDDRAMLLARAKREWLWKALSQRGRNLVSAEYDKLTEPRSAGEEGNG